MINETVLELRKKGFGEDEEEASKMKWSPIQFWKIVQSLGGDDEEVRANISLLLLLFFLY